MIRKWLWKYGWIGLRNTLLPNLLHGTYLWFPLCTDLTLKIYVIFFTKHLWVFCIGMFSYNILVCYYLFELVITVNVNELNFPIKRLRFSHCIKRTQVTINQLHVYINMDSSLYHIIKMSESWLHAFTWVNL